MFAIQLVVKIAFQKTTQKNLHGGPTGLLASLTTVDIRSDWLALVNHHRTLRRLPDDRSYEPTNHCDCTR